MSNNITNRATFHDHLMLNRMPRKITFPMPLQQYSFSKGISAGRIVRHRNIALEFCFRLGSSEASALDIIDGKEYRTPFPYLFFKLPGQNHVNHIFGSREALSLYYDVELLPAFLQAGFDLTLPGRPLIIDKEFQALLRQMHQCAAAIILPGMVEQLDILAFQLLTHTFTAEAHSADSSNTAIQRIASYFHLHFNQKIDLEQLLRQNGLSRRSFFRHWNRTYRHSPTEYLRQLRLKEACRLLRESDLPIDHIIDLVGFADRTGFYHRFRQEMGVTPAEYRQGASSFRDDDAAHRE